MAENFSFLFYYLKKEDINIDHEEFIFQTESHPDYPSLLSFSDALGFFDIPNSAIHIEIEEIDQLPDNFVTILQDDKNVGNKIFYLEKKDGSYFCRSGKKLEIISKNALKSRWKNVVLLIEKPDNENKVVVNKNIFFWLLPTLCLTLFITVLSLFQVNVETKLFFIFPLIGFLFSVAALKDLFGTQNELINSFCNITAFSSCSAVVNSDKWKFFKKLNFSDLSIVFFSTQFLGLFALLLRSDFTSYFIIQKILLLCSIPVLLLSLYYQKYVEKKWCPVCLVIIGVILIEMIYLLLFQENKIIQISYESLFIYLFVCSLILMSWFILKKNIILIKNLKEFKLVGTRFMYNYEIFKSVLLSSDRMKLAYSPIILGNKESNIEITIITSPFCNYCKNAHNVLEKILKDTENKIKIKILINADIDSLDELKKTFFRSLMAIYIERGELSFLEALHSWFINKNLSDWLEEYKLICNENEIDSIYRAQHQWCFVNNNYFTPTIFINDYRYPKMYKREDLEFFIKDLIEDDLFVYKLNYDNANLKPMI